MVSHWYKPDWKIDKQDGSVVYIESKGYFDAADRNKLKYVKAQHPEIDIRLLFQRDNKLHKASNTKYSDWCERHGFPWAVGSIPEEWFE